MKKPVSMFLAALLLLCLVSPVLSADTDADKAAKIRNEITEQNIYAASGADTFWTGLIVGAIGSAVLIPVYLMIENKDDPNLKIFYIAAGAMALTSVVCMAWGGTEWLLAMGRIDELKKAEKDVTIAPYLYPYTHNSVEMGLGMNIRL